MPLHVQAKAFMVLMECILLLAESVRAFAMVSTEVEDCNDNLEDMSPAEMDSLRDWESRFYSKYPIIGNVQSEGQRADAERQKSSRASQAA